MRSLVPIALFLAACTGPGGGRIPEGWIEINEHQEFVQFRPAAIVVLPVEAPSNVIRTELRPAIYKRLFTKRYSAIRLDVVDAHLNSAGVFDPGDLEYDATFETVIEKWEPISGSTRYLAKGHAKMVHKSGELLWECIFNDRPFKVEAQAGSTDISAAIDAIAQLLIDRLPVSPPPGE